MALVIQNVAMTASYVPYERPPQNLTLWSAIPRGLFSFIVDTQQLDLKPVNDDFQLNLNGTLPPGFGYVLADVNCTIAQNRAVDWNAIFTLNLQQWFRGPEVTTIGMSNTFVQDFAVSAADTTQRSSNALQPWPSFPMVGTPGTAGILIVMSMGNNNNTAATVGTINSYISFWQFDLEQIRKYPINSPIPVQAR